MYRFPAGGLWIGCSVSQAVHDVADVVKDVSGQLGKSVVPLVLRRNNVGPPKNGIRLLEPPLGLLGVKRWQLDRHMRPRSVERASSSGGGGVRKIAKLSGKKLSGQVGHRGGRMRRRQQPNAEGQRQKSPVVQTCWLQILCGVTNIVNEHHHS